MKHFPRPAAAAAALFLALAGCLLAALGPNTALSADTPSKLERQIEIFQRAIDEMLVDSPNFLVRGHEVTQGFEDEDAGVFFTFDASLTGMGFESGGLFRFLPWDGAHRVIVIQGDEGKEKGDYIVGGHGIRIRDGKVYLKGAGSKEWKIADEGEWDSMDEGTYRQKQLEKFEAGKQELVDVLIDYGDLLRALPSGRSVKIIAFLKDIDLPEGRDVSKLSLRANIDDLRAYAEGRLTEADVRRRVDVREQ
ncbi:MAG: hypothetical protein ACE15D_08180 [Candidatus Eisenbacteria bacterium]|nr:hypothetical protein [Candidatus Eisenbacteria bacterium]